VIAGICVGSVLHLWRSVGHFAPYLAEWLNYIALVAGLDAQ
jgi:hypothetical protein